MTEYNEEDGQAVIDFGTGCTVADSLTISGQIIVTISEPSFSSDGISLTLSLVLENLFINQKQLEGIQTSVYSIPLALFLGELTAGSLVEFDVDEEIRDGRITFPDGTFILRNSSRNRHVTGTAESESFTQISVTGNASGTGRSGLDYTSDITEEWITTQTCAEQSNSLIPQSGKSEILVTDRDLTVLLDYGDGACDDVLTATINGVSKEISAQDVYNWFFGA